MTRMILVYWNVTERQKQQISDTANALGFSVCFASEHDEARTLAPEAEVLFGRMPDPVRYASRVRWVCTCRAGVNAFLEEDLLPEGCLLSGSSGAYGVAVSEHVLMVTLMMMRRFREYDVISRRDDWRGNLSMDSIAGSRITILGTGDIGRSTACRLRGFEPACITGVNRSGREDDAFDRVYGAEVLDEILPTADLLICALPETPDTIGILSGERIALLPAGAFLVNVGRGSVLDEEALVLALNEGRLSGASLDVTSVEPPPSSSPLRTAKNLLLTPHSAGRMNIRHTTEKIVEQFCEDLERYARGEKLLHEVNREKGY